MDFAHAVDRRIWVTIGPSGGRPTLVMVNRTSLDPIGVAAVNVLDVIGRWFVNKVVYRGGWTVHVDAPDANPRKIRCRSRAAAEACGRRILTEAGVDAATAEPTIAPTALADTAT